MLFRKPTAIGTFIVTLLIVSQVQAMDIVESAVLAYDRKANIIVLRDKTVWDLDLLAEPLTEDFSAGDKIEIRYESNEDDGVQVIHSIALVP